MKDGTKTQLKEFGRPLVRPLLNRLNLMREDIGAARGEIQSNRERIERLEGMSSRLDRLERAIDQILEAISTQNAVARQRQRNTDRIGEQLVGVWDRMSEFAAAVQRVEARAEFVRKEIMYEMHYGLRQGGTAEENDRSPRIVRPEALEERPLRINLGCGHIPMKGFVNIDSRELDGVDVVAGVSDLPFPPGSVDQIHSSHMLEHFPTPQLERLLPYWFSLIAPGGKFTAVLPDGESMVKEYAAGRFGWENLRVSTFGAQEYDGDFHFAMYSAGDLSALLEKAGFEKVNVLATGRPNGDCLEMELEAIKPRSPFE